MDRLDLYTSLVPRREQKMIQRMGFYTFIHYGSNTFTGKEWGDGTASPSIFNPSAQDTDQWAKTIKEAGAEGIILTCKHHDGFCLWPTKTTQYSVANSPYKGGKGDVVKEVSASCKKYGLKFGAYLSPWDRNHPAYSTPAYDDVYIEQMTELLTGYGDLFCIWLDGACGAGMDGKTKQVYDFERYYALVKKLQPKCAISNCGPDVRWVGNEGGFARESEWNVVPRFACDTQVIEAKSQQEDTAEFAKQGATIISDDLGSREFLGNYNDFMWYPSEVDVSIRPGWFYHKSEDNRVRSLKNLLKIYYTSAGGNSLLLLNIPPDKRGLIHENDVVVLKQLGEHIGRFAKEKVEIESITAPEGEGKNIIENVLDNSFDEETFDPKSYYVPSIESLSYEIKIKMKRSEKINRVRLVENTAFSQRIENFEIYAKVGKRKMKVYEGTVVGFNRIAVFNKAVTTDELTIKIIKCRKKPYIEHIAVYRDNKVKIKLTLIQKIVKYAHKISYKSYVKSEAKKNRKAEEKNNK